MDLRNKIVFQSWAADYEDAKCMFTKSLTSWRFSGKHIYFPTSFRGQAYRSTPSWRIDRPCKLLAPVTPDSAPLPGNSPADAQT